MTDQELRDLVAELAASTKDLRISHADLEETVKQTNKQLGELGNKFGSFAEGVALPSRQKAKLVASTSSLDEEFRKAHADLQRTVKQTNKQLGELGNKFGSFAEGMALPSMQKVLYERFGMGIVLPRAKSRLNGHSLEVDTLAYDSVNQEEAYVVEVKSHLTSEGIQQILQTIARVPKFFPHLANRKIYGILAAVHASEQIKNEVLNQGLYLARISDETFKLQVPKKFQAKAFGANGEEQGAKGKKTKKNRK